MDLDARDIWSLVDVLRDDKAPSNNAHTATVSRIEGNTTWVRFPGSTIETPLASTNTTVEVGDTISVEIGNKKAVGSANLSSPAASTSYVGNAIAPVQRSVEQAESATQAAQQAAAEAQQVAEIAQQGADAADNLVKAAIAAAGTQENTSSASGVKLGVNLTPYFSHGMPESGYSDDYWHTLRVIGTTTTISMTEDKWLHVDATPGGGQIRFYIRAQEFVKPNTDYTIMVELRNYNITLGENASTSVIRTANATSSSQIKAASTTDKQIELNEQTSSVHYVTFTSQATVTDKTYLTQGMIGIGTDTALSCDVRLSLYEGEYTGEYVPYVSTSLKAQVDETQAKVDETQAHFWADSGGAHVATVEGDVTQGYSTTIGATGTTTGIVQMKDGKLLSSHTPNALNFYRHVDDAAQLAASYNEDGAMIFDEEGDPSAAFSKGNVTFFDGEGAEAENVVAQFGELGAAIGKTDTDHVYLGKVMLDSQLFTAELKPVITGRPSWDDTLLAVDYPVKYQLPFVPTNTTAGFTVSSATFLLYAWDGVSEEGIIGRAIDVASGAPISPIYNPQDNTIAISFDTFGDTEAHQTFLDAIEAGWTVYLTQRDYDWRKLDVTYLADDVPQAELDLVGFIGSSINLQSTQSSMKSTIEFGETDKLNFWVNDTEGTSSSITPDMSLSSAGRLNVKFLETPYIETRKVLLGTAANGNLITDNKIFMYKSTGGLDDQNTITLSLLGSEKAISLRSGRANDNVFTVDWNGNVTHAGDIAKTAIPLNSAAAAYNAATAPYYTKYGKLVNAGGAVKPTSEVAAGGTLTIGTLPAGFRPLCELNVLCQGSSNATWLLTVTTAGVLQAKRYRNGTTNAAMTTSTWLPFNITFITA